ncbi:alpha/beta hydrolase family protein [Owenweeksia hongkongensis]|uniref:alpha/beta hydrolase family protein n=1 Tax=Owenweeksia hongkongensis TaxID=253245 RepID=UPI003A901B81
MKALQLLSFILFFSCTHAQHSELLVQKRLISDLSKTPLYPKLSETIDGKTDWKKEYRYLDSIDIYIITYMSDGLKIRGLMVKPKKEGNYPCIIFNRGGNRDFGTLKIGHGAITMGNIAKHGYVVIASQYRGNGGSEGQEEFGGNDVNDVLILTEVLKEVEGADTDNIGMYGWSRGGMMTYIALTKTDKIKAAAVGGALADLFTTIEDRPEMESGVAAELIPDYEHNKKQELVNRSAVMWADKFPEDVPILMLHGTTDWRVKPEQSLKLAMEFEKYRVPYRLIMFEGGDHGLTGHTKEKDEQVIRWFDRYLKNGEESPQMEYHRK